jgi:hypothetical protein
MRVFLGAALLVVVVVGGFWLALALFVGHSDGAADAFARSATCARHSRSLADDRADSTRFHAAGLRTLGLRWRGVRAVALFSDSLSPDPVTRVEARIASRLSSHGVSAAEIGTRLLHEDNVGLFYVNRAPSQAAQAAIGRCVYLIHFNRIASFFGLYVSPHARRPFLPGATRDER